MPRQGQLDIWSEGPTARLGLTVPHRQFMSGLESEWLEPGARLPGHVLSPEAPGVLGGSAGRSTPVTLWFDPTALPDRDILVYSGSDWRTSSIARIDQGALAVFWPGALPLGCVSGATVPTREAESRLRAVAAHVSNIDLPPIKIEHRRAAAPVELSLEQARSIEPIGLVDDYDSVRGAAAMAWWAIPRTRPWYDLLTKSFMDEPIDGLAKELGAPWLRALPWRPRAPSVGGFEDTLWRAAMSASIGHRGTPASLLARIFNAAQAESRDQDQLQQWTTETAAILSGRAALKPNMSQSQAAAGIQIFLARQAPTAFATWRISERNLPPAAWWCGAILSGMTAGYQRLPRTFRGIPAFRRHLAMRFTEPRFSTEEVSWMQKRSTTVFSIGTEVVAERGHTARTRWFEADLSSEKLAIAALRQARGLGWPCIRRELVLPPGGHTFVGGGALRVRKEKLHVDGHVRVLLDGEVRSNESLDTNAFQHALVTLGGDVKGPPEGAGLPVTAIKPNVEAVPGLIYVADFLDSTEQDAILREVDASPWREDLLRRVQHYGWRYDYKARRVSKDMRIGELPRWAQALASRLEAEGLLPWLPDQVIVNEYVESQGISPHIDLPEAFENAVAMVSLIEAWHMRFRHKPSKTREDHLLGIGSVAVMTGPSRYEWTHEIPFRKTENRRKRGRRVSLTFRRVRSR